MLTDPALGCPWETIEQEGSVSHEGRYGYLHEAPTTYVLRGYLEAILELPPEEVGDDGLRGEYPVVGDWVGLVLL